jgi:hypothetical protein
MEMRTLGLSIGVLVMCLVTGCATPGRTLRPIAPNTVPERRLIEFPKAPPTAVFKVIGDVPGVDYATWQNTGVQLRYGDVVYIQAEGQLNFATDLTCGPEGRGYVGPLPILPQVSFCALIGKTHRMLLDDGHDSSQTGLYGPGFIGSEFVGVYSSRSDYGQTGENILYLAVNDSTDNDNSLSFTARIWVVRGGNVVKGN